MLFAYRQIEGLDRILGMGEGCGDGKLSVSGEKPGWELLCSTSSLHLEANPYKTAITVPSKKRRRWNCAVRAVCFSLNVAFLFPFYRLADGESLFALTQLRATLFVPFQAELHEMPESNIPRKCKISFITVISLLTQVISGG